MTQSHPIFKIVWLMDSPSCWDPCHKYKGLSCHHPWRHRVVLQQTPPRITITTAMARCVRLVRHLVMWLGEYQLKQEMPQDGYKEVHPMLFRIRCNQRKVYSKGKKNDDNDCCGLLRNEEMPWHRLSDRGCDVRKRCDMVHRRPLLKRGTKKSNDVQQRRHNRVDHEDECFVLLYTIGLVLVMSMRMRMLRRHSNSQRIKNSTFRLDSLFTSISSCYLLSVYRRDHNTRGWRFARRRAVKSDDMMMATNLTRIVIRHLNQQSQGTRTMGKEERKYGVTVKRKMFIMMTTTTLLRREIQRYCRNI
mmetsp:Transcript_27096/g.39668  ORF Transcript_27096/g.39668 Transcript_27096/m.39668 type:complete len:304 (-) Transcript_27096:244-1155(-)